MKKLFAPLLSAALLLAAASASAQTPVPEPTPEPTAEPTPEATPEPEGGNGEGDAASREGQPGGPPSVHGFITVRYLVDDGKTVQASSENAYEVQWARVNIDGKAHRLVRYFLSMELADLKAAAPTPFREAYVIWNPTFEKPWLKKILPEFRVGRMRKPGGLESFQDESELITTDRSLVSGYFSNDDQEAPNQDYRDIGLRAGGEWGPVEAAGVGMTNGVKGADSSSQPNADTDQSKDVAGRVGVKFGKPDGPFPFFLRAGTSASGGRDYTNHQFIDGTNVIIVEYWNASADALLLAGPLHVQIEGVYGKRTILDFATETGLGDTATGSAGYILVAYRIKGKTAPFFRFAYRDPSMNMSDEDLQIAKDWANEVTVGVNVALVKKRLTARAQYTLRHGFTNPHPSNLGLGAYNESPHGVAAASIQAEF